MVPELLLELLTDTKPQSIIIIIFIFSSKKYCEAYRREKCSCGFAQKHKTQKGKNIKSDKLEQAC